MAELASYHVPEGPPRKVAQVNFVERLKEHQAAKSAPSTKPQPRSDIRPPQPVPPPTPSPKPQPSPVPAPPKTSAPVHERHGMTGERLVRFGAGAAVILLLLAAGILGYRHFATSSRSVVTATPRPTSPTKTLPNPVEVVPQGETPGPAPSLVSGQIYTVVPGDTLITIGEKLGKDWHQIAAANNNITDPSFITPGEVLRIP